MKFKKIMTQKDFKMLEKLCNYQAPTSDIVDTLGLPADEIRAQAILYYGKIWNLSEEECTNFTWRELRKRLAVGGRNKLRGIQWRHAEKSVEMAKFLGKQYLDQSDNPTSNDTGNISQLINAINSINGGK